MTAKRPARIDGVIAQWQALVQGTPVHRIYAYSIQNHGLIGDARELTVACRRHYQSVFAGIGRQPVDEQQGETVGWASRTRRCTLVGRPGSAEARACATERHCRWS